MVHIGENGYKGTHHRLSEVIEKSETSDAREKMMGKCVKKTDWKVSMLILDMCEDVWIVAGSKIENGWLCRVGYLL